MTQHDFNFANQTFPSMRSDLNDAMQAAVTLSAGSTAPTATFPNMPWVDTSGARVLLKKRTNADAAWKILGDADADGLLVTYAGDPNGNVAGDFIGQECWDTSNSASYRCTTVGVAASAEWKNVTAATLNGYIAGPPPVWKSASTITIKAGTTCMDASNTAIITFSSDLDVALTTSGANGLDTGSEASATWYYLWAIRKSTDGTVAGLLSVSASSPTMPSGYDQKRLLPVAVRNDGSSNILPFYVARGWPFCTEVRYNNGPGTYFNGSAVVAGGCNVLSTGTSTSWASVDASAYIPVSLSRVGLVNLYGGNQSGFWSVRESGSTYNGQAFGNGASGNVVSEFTIRASTAGAYEYIRRYATAGSGHLYIDINGYVASEIT